MKLTKTEKRLLQKLQENGGRTGYHGCREAAAARKLQTKGLVDVHASDGWYPHPRRIHGKRWVERRYYPQGVIQTTTKEQDRV